MIAMKGDTAASGGDQGIPEGAILEQLKRILARPEFQRSKRNSEFLEFVITETLAGRADAISGYTIGINVFERDDTFDPSFDPIVRNQAKRLRRALDRYYYLAGADDPILIELPKGGYVPTFSHLHREKAQRSGRLVEHAAFGLPTGPSIAVLPFMNLGDDPVQEFFADGLSEELIIELSRFQDFLVVGRQSTLRYRGAAVDLREVGRDLNVGYILTGSLQRSADRLRIAVKLTDTRTGGLLWVNRFEGNLAAPDIFQLQQEITSEVVSRVADSYGVIPRDLAKATRRKQTDELSSYEAVLRYHHYAAGPAAESYGEVRAALEAAVARDPSYALAWAKLSELLCDDFTFGYSREPGLLDRAMEFARRAISLDPEGQDGYVSLLWCQFQRRERTEVLRTAARVVDLNPNAAHALGFAGFAIALAGEWHEGLALVEKALRLNPYNPGWLLLPQWADHMRSAEYEEALETARNIANPASVERLIAEAAALGHLGRHEEGRRAVATLLEANPDYRRTGVDVVRRIMFLDETAELVLDGLRLSGFEPANLNS